MTYTDEEKYQRAREVSERTGVPAKLLEYTTPDDMENLAYTIIEHAESQQPKVHAAPAAKRSRIVRGGEYRQTTGEQFADFIRDTMRWA